MRPHVRGVLHLLSASFYLLIWKVLHLCPGFILSLCNNKGLEWSWHKLLIPSLSCSLLHLHPQHLEQDLISRRCSRIFFG